MLTRSGRTGVTHFSIVSEGTTAEVKVIGGPQRFVVADVDGSLTIDADTEGNILIAVLDGASCRYPFAIDGRRVAIRARSIEAVFEVRPAVEAALDAAATVGRGDGTSILAPMPGLIADIMVAVGDDVTAGQTVAVLESMKLFTDLKAVSAGRIVRVAATRGETIAANALIIAVEPTEVS